MSSIQERILTLNAEESSFGPLESLNSQEPIVLDAGSTPENFSITVGDLVDISLTIGDDGSVAAKANCSEYLTEVLIDQVKGATAPQRKLLKDSSRAIYKHRRAQEARVVAEKKAAEAEQDKKVLDSYKKLGSQPITLDHAAQVIYNNITRSPDCPSVHTDKIKQMIQACIGLKVPVQRRFFELI